MQRIILILFFSSFISVLYGQGISADIQQIIEDYVADNDRSEEDVEILYEDLFYLNEHPLNLNVATAEDLERLPFLTPFQINSFIDYRQRYGLFVSIYELQAIYGFDQSLIKQLLPFITLASVENDYKRKVYWKHQLLLRTTAVLEPQEGYHRSDSLSHYQGAPYSALMKYTGSLKKSWSWHLTGDQDRGEPWGQHAALMDFVSAGVQYQGEKWLKNAIIGDYRLCFGEGLLVNNNFGYGKSSQVLNISQTRPALRRSTSTSEFGFFRGAATHLSLGAFDVYLGASSRLADASVDSLDGQRIIRSFAQTGFHRTENEVAKYKNEKVNDAFMHLDYSFSEFKFGLSLAAQSLDHTFLASERADNAFVPSYTELYSGSINYKWNRRGVIFFGEMAALESGALAGVQGLSASPSSRVALSVLYRYYSASYYAPYAQAFAEGSHVRNEEGLYMGLNLLIAKGWSLDTYFDFYRFPWLRFGQSRPTNGYDFFLQPNYDLSRKTSMYWRFKYEEKEEMSSNDSPQDVLVSSQKLNLRYHLKSEVNEYISLQTRVAASYALHLKDEHGFMLYQDIKGKFFDERLALTLRYALYNTSSYESRIYTYETDVLYLSYTPALYGRGTRTFLNTSFKVNPHLTLYLKTAYSQSYDGHLFGSGLDATNQDHKTDIHLQLRYKF